MGGSGSKSMPIEKALAEHPDNIYGLDNFGNTCYANSVLQALFFCVPFRTKVIEYAHSLQHGRSPQNLLTCLADLFAEIANAKRKTGSIAPRKFIERLKEDNELFASFMHQDAHEFLNYLLNEACDILEKEDKAKRPPRPTDAPVQPVQTWVHDIFQGKLVNETRCLMCETVTRREEVFMDLSLEIDQNCSVTSCLKNFSATETLDRDDKFFCDHCCCLQEAQKRMLISKIPRCLILHLKRFKYVESQGMMRKLMYRVVFPMDLKLSNTTADAEGVDSPYALHAVVVHVGSGPSHGHYVSLVKSHAHWLFFDDENVEMITESQISSTFGSTGGQGNGGGNTDHGYLLFYSGEDPSK